MSDDLVRELEDKKKELADVKEQLRHLYGEYEKNIGKRSNIRPVLMWFAELMEDKLRENDYKGGWDRCSVEYLWDRLWDEYLELSREFKLNLEKGVIRDESNGKIVVNDNDVIDRVIDECLDVANFSMMIADRINSCRIGDGNGK